MDNKFCFNFRSEKPYVPRRSTTTYSAASPSSTRRSSQKPNSSTSSPPSWENSPNWCDGSVSSSARRAPRQTLRPPPRNPSRRLMRAARRIVRRVTARSRSTWALPNVWARVIAWFRRRRRDCGVRVGRHCAARCWTTSGCRYRRGQRTARLWVPGRRSMRSTCIGARMSDSN